MDFRTAPSQKLSRSLGLIFSCVVFFLDILASIVPASWKEPTCVIYRWKALEFLFPTVYLRGPQPYVSGYGERKTSGLCLIWDNGYVNQRTPIISEISTFREKCVRAFFA